MRETGCTSTRRRRCWTCGRCLRGWGAIPRCPKARHLGAPKPVTERTVSGVTVVIPGDIRHSRVARSNAMLLPRLGAKVILCGPEELLPDEATQLLNGFE